MKKVVQFGAGNIGRGFLGQLFYESGYEIVFVEARDEIVNLLNKKKAYILKIVGEKSSEVTIKNIRCVNSKDADAVAEEIAGANLIATAVGVNVLKFVAPLIAGGLEKRIEKGNLSPIDIIICENLMNANEIFKQMILGTSGSSFKNYVDEKIGFVQAVVSRMVPAVPADLLSRDPLLVFAEAYKELPVDKPGFKGEIPDIVGMEPIGNFHAYEERKLFTHNAGHAIAAYLGYKKGYTYIYEAVKDVEIRGIVLGAIRDESGRALIKKHSFSPADYESHVNDLINRFSNVALGDTVARVGKDPIRKLKPNDRLIGGARLAIEYNIKPENFVRGIKSVLAYDNPEDKEAAELQSLLKTKGLDAVLREICGLDKKGDKLLFQLIKEEK
jgi:mannitol-1-phosphate 5-dehydrogenase